MHQAGEVLVVVEDEIAIGIEVLYKFGDDLVTEFDLGIREETKSGNQVERSVAEAICFCYIAFDDLDLFYIFLGYIKHAFRQVHADGEVGVWLEMAQNAPRTAREIEMTNFSVCVKFLNDLREDGLLQFPNG